MKRGDSARAVQDAAFTLHAVCSGVSEITGRVLAHAWPPKRDVPADMQLLIEKLDRS